MPHHFTKRTVSATFRCSVCGRDTLHHVYDGRRGGCHVCIAKRDVEHDQREAEKRSPPEKQMDLLGEKWNRWNSKT